MPKLPRNSGTLSAAKVIEPLKSQGMTSPAFRFSRSARVTVDSPRTQALIGFLQAREAGDDNLEAEVENKFCSIQLSSLDAMPISQSSKMLLIAGGHVENTGQRWNSAGTDVTNWGDSPTLIEPVVGTLTLRHLEPAHSIQLQAIDGSGQPIGAPVSAIRAGGSWKIPLGGTVTTWYELTVSR